MSAIWRAVSLWLTGVSVTAASLPRWRSTSVSSADIRALARSQLAVLTLDNRQFLIVVATLDGKDVTTLMGGTGGPLQASARDNVLYPVPEQITVHVLALPLGCQSC